MSFINDIHIFYKFPSKESNQLNFNQTHFAFLIFLIFIEIHSSFIGENCALQLFDNKTFRSENLAWLIVINFTVMCFSINYNCFSRSFTVDFAHFNKNRFISFWCTQYSKMIQSMWLVCICDCWIGFQKRTQIIFVIISTTMIFLTLHVTGIFIRFVVDSFRAIFRNQNKFMWEYVFQLSRTDLSS